MAVLSQNFEFTVGALMPDFIWQDAQQADDPLMKAFPFGYEDADKVKWDQYENPYGLIPYRGLDGNPPLVSFPGFRQYNFDPGYFGGYTQLSETEITAERQPGTIASPLDVDDRLGMLMLHASTMIVSRCRKMLSDMLVAGKFTVTGAQGQVYGYQVDGYRTKVPGVGWNASPTTAVPINDMLQWQAELQRGTSSKFGGESILLANSNTIAELFKTTQIQTSYRTKYGASVIGLDGAADLAGLNSITQGFDLPKIVRYDHGYYPTLADAVNRTTANFTYIIPNRTLIWLGKRPDTNKVGQFQLTRHAGLVETGQAKGYPSIRTRNTEAAEIAKGLYVRSHYINRMPHHYDLEFGFNGGPVMWWGSAAAGITYS